jgi:hypothetical protein
LVKRDFLPSEKITIYGSMEPGAKVVLEVGNHSYEALANTGGEWTIEIDCGEIDQGDFSMALTVTDLAGNKARESLGRINIEPVQESVSAAQQSSTLALENDVNVKTDVKPEIIYSRNDEFSSQQSFAPAEKDSEEIAVAGNLIPAAIDEKQNGLNWSVILVVLSVIALASAAIAAGYYGYEYIILSGVASGKRARSAKAERIINKVKDTTESGRERSETSTKDTDSTNNEDSPHKTRW